MQATWQRATRQFGVPFFVRFFLAAVFATAAIAKVQNFAEFESTLVASMLVPRNFILLMAWAVVALELILSIGIWIPGIRLAVLQAGAMLCCIFLGYSLWRWLQAIPVPCHCFGKLLTMAPWHGVLLNIVLLLGLVSLLSAEVTPSDRLRYSHSR